MRNKSENASAYSGEGNGAPLLYTYVPKENTVERDGLLSTRLTAEGYRKYMDRFGTKEREDTLRALDRSIPGFQRSKSISFLPSPIPDDADPKLVDFARRNRLYRVDAAQLLAAGMVRKAVVADKTFKYPEADLSKPMRIDWKKKKAGRYLFSNVPHLFLETAGGRIPPEFVTAL